MIALVYLLVCSMANRLRAQVARLRKPKYLCAAVVGGLYFWFFLFRGFASGRSASGEAPGTGLWPNDGDRLLVESAAALLVAGGMLLSWLIPSRRAALEFTEAEVAFLFPAPLSRLTLINFRLLRSQPALVFTGALMALFGGRMLARGPWWAQVLSWWAVFSALEFHRLGAAFVRTRWLDRGLTNARRRVLVLLAVAGVIIGAIIWGRWAYPPLAASALEDAERLKAWGNVVVGSGPVFWILLPFRLLFQPMLAPNWRDAGMAALPAVGLLTGLYVWVIRSRVAFEEASLELSHQRARAVKLARAGQWHLAQAPAKARRDPFPLATKGPRWVAYLWKNLIAGRVVASSRTWAVLAVALLVPLIGLAVFNSRGGGGWVVGVICLALLPVTFLAGPQLLMFDLRQDLPLAEVLKTHPISARQMVLGQVAAPAVVLWGLQIALVVVATVALASVPGRVKVELSWPTLIGWAVTGILVAPGIDVLSLTLLNAMSAAFPSWVRLDPGRARSFEAMGQYLIVMFGQLAVLSAALIGPALTFAVAFVLGKAILPVLPLAPLSGVLALAVLAGEAWILIGLTGRLFERLDVSEESIPTDG